MTATRNATATKARTVTTVTDGAKTEDKTILKQLP